MTQVTYLLIQPVTASPLKKYFEFTFENFFEIFRNLKYFEFTFENIFEIFQNLKYFEIYCEMFRNILHMRNLSKDFACSQDLSKDCATINLLMYLVIRDQIGHVVAIIYLSINNNTLKNYYDLNKFDDHR